MKLKHILAIGLLVFVAAGCSEFPTSPPSDDSIGILESGGSENGSGGSENGSGGSENGSGGSENG